MLNIFAHHNILSEDNYLSQETQFLLNLSHELRNPLTTITGYLELLGATQLDAKQQQYLKAIQHSSYYLINLTEEILSGFRAGGECRGLTLSSFNLRDFLQSLVDLYEPLAFRKGLGFFLEVSNLPESINGDAIKLKQVLVNLLNNAVKFTSQGWIRLQVNGFERDAKTVEVIFRVVDTGIGISGRESEEIFEAFYQCQGGSGGVGLGLAISKVLCEVMGGTLSVNSRPGVGSCFEVSLPMELRKANPLEPLKQELSTLSPSLLENLQAMASRGDFRGLETYIKTSVVPIHGEFAHVLLG